MEVQKKEAITFINTFEKLYKIILNTPVNNINELTKIISITSKMIINIQPLFRNHSSFEKLFEATSDLLKSLVAQNIREEEIEKKKLKVLNEIENFEIYLMSLFSMKVFLHPESKWCNLLKNEKEIYFISNAQEFNELKVNMSNSISVLLGYERLIEINSFFDIIITDDDITESFNKLGINYKNIDYYLYDQLYLDAKLESLKENQNIELLLAGSSYTMCGLLEREMPVPSRNTAVDAQDLYYAIKTIEKSIEYNPNIKYCVLSFAYYLWGYDLSLSSSPYQLKRITEVNYPVFKDSHNLSVSIAGKENKESLILTSPLLKQIFAYKQYREKQLDDIKKDLQNSDYFKLPRTKSTLLDLTEEENMMKAKIRANSHNKFFRYKKTVEENLYIFEKFIAFTQENNIQLLVYSPPITSYYRKFIKPELINDFYRLMNPLIEKHAFKYIDFFDSPSFTNEDFYDYDHLNYMGAKKFSDIISFELKL